MSNIYRFFRFYEGGKGRKKKIFYFLIFKSLLRCIELREWSQENVCLLRVNKERIYLFGL